MRFNIIFDNYKYDDNLESLWGFSCLIELEGQTILFDTGSNGRILLNNAKKMGLNFKNIDILFISHNHWDHIGGIDTIIEENPNIIMIVPNSLSKYLIEDLKSLVKEVIVIDGNFTKLSPFLYSTGTLGNIKEQSLIIKDNNNKLYVISGCGHVGIDNILKVVIDNMHNDIKYILGGFHLMNKSPKEIKQIILKINPEFITATHCSGDLAIGMMKIDYKNKFLIGGAGAIIEF